METLVTTHIDFSTGGDSGRYHEETLKRLIAKANAAMPEWKRDADVNAWLLAGEYQRVLDWYAGLSTPSDEDRSFAAWAHVDLGNRDAADAAKYVESDLPAARRLWAAAAERYAQALAIKPDMHEAANNWGSALNAEARAVAPTDLAEARCLWAAAGERYAQALAIKPDKHEAANNWGITLNAEARAVAPTDLAEARRLWAAAAEHYAQALAIKPDKHEAANNWCAMLSTQYHLLKPSAPDEASLLLDQAEQLALRAESIRPGSATYNLACIHSLKDDLPTALEGLRTAHTAGSLPSTAHLRADPDLAPLRADPAFQTWWREVFGPDEPLDAPAA